jgi:ribonuclease D
LANIICPDDVLRRIAQAKPKSYAELMQITGFNQGMFNKIGEEVIATVKEFEQSTATTTLLKNNNLPESISFVHDLVMKKYSLHDISKLTKLPESVLAVQIETILEMIPSLEIDSLFEKNELKSIYQKINDGITELKELKSVVGNSIGYAKLRIALAKKRVN